MLSIEGDQNVTKHGTEESLSGLRVLNKLRAVRSILSCPGDSSVNLWIWHEIYLICESWNTCGGRTIQCYFL